MTATVLAWPKWVRVKQPSVPQHAFLEQLEMHMQKYQGLLRPKILIKNWLAEFDSHKGFGTAMYCHFSLAEAYLPISDGYNCVNHCR